MKTQWAIRKRLKEMESVEKEFRTSMFPGIVVLKWVLGEEVDKAYVEKFLG
jgi:hypothetical protein